MWGSLACRVLRRVPGNLVESRASTTDGEHAGPHTPCLPTRVPLPGEADHGSARFRCSPDESVVLGRTHLGFVPRHHDPRDHLGPPGASRSANSGLLREDPRAPAGARPARPADPVVRVAGRRRGVVPASHRRRRRESGRRSRGDPHRDLADRRLLRLDVAVLLRPALRRGQGLRRGVQGQGHDVRGSAVRHRGVHQQHHRRDQVPDGLHGRLPRDDRQGHLHHQRHRACRRVAAGPLAGHLLRPQHRQDHREGRLLGQDHPQPRRVAGVRRRQARHRRRPDRPQASPAGHRAAQGPGLDGRAGLGPLRRSPRR